MNLPLPAFANEIAKFAVVENRAAVSRSLASRVGAQDLLVFIADPDTDTFLPGRGFPQTLPAAGAWQDFLTETVAHGQARARLPYTTDEMQIECIGHARDHGAVMVFIGDSVNGAEAQTLIELLPLLATLCRVEWSLINAKATMALAHNAATKLREQAVGLEQARRMAHQELLERQRAEEKLAWKAAELERSNRDLQHFAAIVSHDLQEPLRMVSSYVSLIERRLEPVLDDKSKSYIGRATSGTERMALLITALLSYAQVGASDRKFVRVPLHAVLHDAVSNIAQRIAERMADVQVGELPDVIGDHVLLVQLFQNLLSNALKFMRPGVDPVITVSATENAIDVEITVTDNGIGIAPEHLERIFGVFQRIHSRAEFEGSGIGLATCRRIVELHGGRISARSQLGSGSAFMVTLPKGSA